MPSPSRSGPRLSREKLVSCIGGGMPIPSSPMTISTASSVWVTDIGRVPYHPTARCGCLHWRGDSRTGDRVTWWPGRLAARRTCALRQRVQCANPCSFVAEDTDHVGRFQLELAMDSLHECACIVELSRRFADPLFDDGQRVLSVRTDRRLRRFACPVNIAISVRMSLLMSLINRASGSRCSRFWAART